MMLLGIAEIKGVDQVREEHGADQMSMAAPHGSPASRRCKCNEHATERTMRTESETPTNPVTGRIATAATSASMHQPTSLLGRRRSPPTVRVPLTVAVAATRETGVQQTRCP